MGVFVSGYEGGVSAGRGSRVRLGVDVAGYGSHRLRTSVDMVGRAHAAPLAKPATLRLLSGVLPALLRLALPVVLLLVLSSACLIYGDVSTNGLATFAGRPMRAGLALLPTTFLAVHLTNRRYGAAYAFAQVLLAWAVTAMALPSLLPTISRLPNTRVVVGFGAGLFLSQIVAVIVFDALRGPRWWTAPFFASLIGGAVLSLAAFPASFAGDYSGWPREMFEYLEICAAAALILLFPYALLRSLIPPRPGFGGY